jgi:PAS domain S-box-containing protein
MRKSISLLVWVSIIFLSSGVFHSFSAPKLKGEPIAKPTAQQQFQVNRRFEIDALNGLSTKYIDSLQILSYELAEKALKQSKIINYKKGQAVAYLNLGFNNYRKKIFLEALEDFTESLKIAEITNDEYVQNEAFKGMVLIFIDLGRNDRAIEYINRGIAYSKKNNKDDLAGDFIRLGQLMYEQGDTTRAFILFFNALSLKPKLTRLVSQIWVMKSLGNLYLTTKRYDIALYYYREAIKENPKDLGNLNGTIYSIIAHTYEQNNDLENSLYFNRIALTIRKKENKPWLVTSSLLNVGHIYLKLGKYDSSLFYLSYGLKNADQFHMNTLSKSGYKNLYELFLIKKDWKNALTALQNFNRAEDMVENDNNKYQVTLVENNRIVNEKEKQTERLKAENAIQKLEVKNGNLFLLLVISLSLITIAAAIYFQRLFRKNAKEKKVVEEMNVQLKDEIEIQVLQNEELSRREKEYRFLADHSVDLITLMDEKFKCLYISPSSEYFFGYSPEELKGVEDFRDLIHPDSKKSFALEFESMMEFRDATRFVYKINKNDGSILWVESNINPIFDSSTGELSAMLSVTRDISNKIDQEEALMEVAKHNEFLIKEVHHRVKNNLAILTSLVNMQKKEFTDVKTLDVFSDLQFRVRAMALVHEQLYKSRNIEVLPIGEYLTNLVGIVTSAFSRSKVEVHQKLYEEIVDVEITLSLGLIVNELLTNAFKYAFPDNKEGNIWVSYKKIHRRKKDTVEMRCLTVKDDGIGLPDGFDFSQRTSMGSQIIHLLVGQLGGEIKIEGTKGASFSLILPLER